MATYIVTDQETGIEYEIEGPDDATDEELQAFAEESIPKLGKEPPTSFSEDLGEFAGNIKQGAGLALKELGQGARQRFNQATDDDEDLERLREEIEDTRGDYDDLTGTGTAGYWATKIGLPLLSTLLFKKPKLLTGIGLGAGAAALEPTLPEDEIMGVPAEVANPVLGGVLGGAGEVAGGALSKLARSRLDRRTSELAAEQARNAPRDQAALEALQEGYRLRPGAVNPDSRLAKIADLVAGPSKLEKTLQSKNQDVTDMLARKALGVGPEEPLDHSTLEAIRDAAGLDYEVVKQVPYVNWDQSFNIQVQKALPQLKTATKLRSDKAAAKLANDILEKKSWTGEEFIEETRRLRELERSHEHAARVAGGDRPRIEHEEIARAARKVRSALENLAERNMQAQGLDPDAIDAFKRSRRRIAITHDIESALTPDGHVDARKIAKLYDKRRGKMDKNLGKIGSTARQFGESLKPHQGSPLLDFMPSLSNILGGGFAYLMHPPLSTAILTVPPAMRGALRTKIGQRAMVHTPKYRPGLSYTLPDSLQLDRSLIAPSVIGGMESLEEDGQ